MIYYLKSKSNTPLQARTYQLYASSLKHIHWIWNPLKDLVKRTASWFFWVDKFSRNFFD